MKTIILSGLLGGSLMLSGCNTTPNTTTTTTTQTTRAATVGNENIKIINGKRYVYVRRELGSNIPGHWVPEDSAEARLAQQTGTIDRGTIQRTQDSPGQGLAPGGAKAIPLNQQVGGH